MGGALFRVNWTKLPIFWTRVFSYFCWNFTGVQSIKSQYWFRWWLGTCSAPSCSAPSHYLNQCWPDSLTHICITRPQWVNGCKPVWSSIAQSVCQRAFSLLANRCLGSRVRILLSAEEDNLSPFDSKIACLCQSIKINNNKYVYRQSQVRKSTDSGAKWAESSLIIGTGCRVQVLSLILDSSVGLSASIQSAGE